MGWLWISYDCKLYVNNIMKNWYMFVEIIVIKVMKLFKWYSIFN